MTGQQPQAASGPYDGMGDEEVLARAGAALRKVPRYPMGSLQRSIAWATYNSAAAELDRRLARHLVQTPLAVLADLMRRAERGR